LYSNFTFAAGFERYYELIIQKYFQKMSGYVQTAVQDGVATITFFHPAQNALPAQLLSELAAAIQEAGNNPTAQVVVLRSDGDKTFCAGASFDELAAIKTSLQGKQFFMGFANVINAMRTCPKFIVARVQGRAVGGGVGLAAAADYAIASQFATVKLSELAIGIGPFVIGPAVERKLGLAAYSEMAIAAFEWRTAHWAKQKGLFQEVFDSQQQMNEYLTYFCDKLKTYSPAAMRRLKQIFWHDTDHWKTLLEERAEISGKFILLDTAQKAIQSFKK
jgi:methylglutaconyl-CoA hydratase